MDRILLIRTESSGLLSVGSDLLYEGDGVLTSALIITDFTNNVTLAIYDNTAASGKVLYKCPTPGSDGYGGRNWIFPVEFLIGLYYNISGTNGEAIIEYSTQRIQ